MKQVFFLLVFTAISVIGFSQTKRIAHRSHSGKDYSFNISFTGSDNFGLPVPDSNKKKPSLKTAVKKDTLKTAVPAKDTLKNLPGSTPADTIKHTARINKVYKLLSLALYVCTSR